MDSPRSPVLKQKLKIIFSVKIQSQIHQNILDQFIIEKNQNLFIKNVSMK